MLLSGALHIGCSCEDQDRGESSGASGAPSGGAGGSSASDGAPGGAAGAWGEAGAAGVNSREQGQVGGANAAGASAVLPRDPRYLLLNVSAGPGSEAVIRYVEEEFGASNRESKLSVGVSVIYSGIASPDSEFERLEADLALAEQRDVPILVQVDTENWLPLDLVNWYDPKLPGYDPKNVDNVEWYGWTSASAIQLSWRNWGQELRVLPAPNLLAPAFLARAESTYARFLPAVVAWYEALPPEKKRLFVGWKCGWETSVNVNAYHYAGGNAYYGKGQNPPANTPRVTLGYNAIQTLGLQTSGDVMQGDLWAKYARVVGKYLSGLAEQAHEAGLPRSKIFVHGVTYGTLQKELDATVNPYSNPGVSYYPDAKKRPIRATRATFMQAVEEAKRRGASGYAVGEFNLFTQDYATWFSYLDEGLASDDDCLYESLYNANTLMDSPSVERAVKDVLRQHPAR
jgi:hypothetical protein